MEREILCECEVKANCIISFLDNPFYGFFQHNQKTISFPMKMLKKGMKIKLKVEVEY